MEETTAGGEETYAYADHDYQMDDDTPIACLDYNRPVVEEEPFDYVGLFLDLNVDSDFSLTHFPVDEYGVDIEEVRLSIAEAITRGMVAKYDYRTSAEFHKKPKKNVTHLKCTYSNEMKRKMLKVMGHDSARFNDPVFMTNLKKNIKLEARHQFGMRQARRIDEENNRSHFLMLIGELKPGPEMEDITKHPLYQLYEEFAKMQSIRKIHTLQHPGSNLVSIKMLRQHKVPSLDETNKKFLDAMAKHEATLAKLKEDRALAITTHLEKKKARKSRRHRSLKFLDFEAPIVRKMNEQEDLDHLHHIADKIKDLFLVRTQKKKRVVVKEEDQEQEFSHSPDAESEEIMEGIENVDGTENMKDKDRNNEQETGQEAT